MLSRPHGHPRLVGQRERIELCLVATPIVAVHKISEPVHVLLSSTQLLSLPSLKTSSSLKTRLGLSLTSSQCCKRFNLCLSSLLILVPTFRHLRNTPSSVLISLPPIVGASSVRYAAPDLQHFRNTSWSVLKRLQQPIIDASFSRSVKRSYCISLSRSPSAKGSLKLDLPSQKRSTLSLATSL